MPSIKLKDNGCVFTNESILDGKSYSMFLPVNPEKLAAWVSMPTDKKPFIQDFFEELNDEQREFILTGITPSKWSSLFGNGYTLHEVLFVICVVIFAGMAVRLLLALLYWLERA